MKDVKVLGTGCANCANTYRLIEEVARARGVDLRMEKVEDLNRILAMGVMSTPAVIVDGKVVHSGGVPARGKVESWF